ncbi:MAG TPA: hypothetical protein PLT91_02365 [Clostridia bacterium]|nr:MAG: hypothetical protein BWX97_01212 [Firmicutes bacterium ADurb.Bin146]HOD93135.1 hypothetical protein [Clostridia bacterium]HQM39068.1 hypothetical protein [Clostridia bacterium]
MITYFHVPNVKVKDAVAFGMKLSEYGDSFIKTGSGLKTVIVSYLCPADDIKKYNIPGYTCLCIDVPIEKTYVIEGAYLEMENANALAASLIKASDYRLGTYRKPLVLITTTIFSENIKVLGKFMDVPIIVDDSSELYLKSALEELENNDNHYYEKALSGYLTVSEDARKIGEKNGYIEYLLNNKKYIVRKPGNK